MIIISSVIFTIIIIVTVVVIVFTTIIVLWLLKFGYIRSTVTRKICQLHLVVWCLDPFLRDILPLISADFRVLIFF